MGTFRKYLISQHGPEVKRIMYPDIIKKSQESLVLFLFCEVGTWLVPQGPGPLCGGGGGP